jgi:HK97 gp10 family phage protein
MAGAINITGLAELSEMLTTIAPRCAKSYMVKCSKPAAQVIVEAMQSTAPDESGKLRDNIVYQNKWGQGEDGGEALITSVGPARRVPYGMFQEFGTSHMAGKHWMGNAWSACQETVLDVYMTGINELYARLVARDQSEAMIENDESDRSGSSTPSQPRMKRDRNAAYRENNERNRVSLVQHSSGISKSENEAYHESRDK